MPNPTQNSILIYRSVTGIDPADFALIQTIPDPGGAWTWTDPGPLVAGQTYIYEAQRYQRATDSFSALSPPVYATGPAPGGTEAMPGTTAIGLQSKLGIGRETTYGTPVLAQKLLDRKSGTLDIAFTDPDHERLAGITSDVESVAGTSNVTGQVKLTPSPEGISRMVSSMMGEPTVVTTAAAIGPPAVSAYQTLTWLDTFAQIPHTLAELKGPTFSLYPGMKSNGFTVSIDKEQNTPIEMDFDVMALNKLLQVSEAMIGTDAAGLDPLPAWGPAQVLAMINSLVTDSAKTFSLDFKKGMKPRQVLNQYRGPVSHYVGKTALTGSIGQYFDTDASLKIFFGNLDAQATPYGASKIIRTVPLVVTLASAVNAAGFVNSLILTVPRASFKKVGQPVNGPDEIMQMTDFRAYHDAATGSCFKLQLVNSETLAGLQTAGTAVSAGQVPINGIQPLVV